jgi:hypothetical protein
MKWYFDGCSYTKGHLNRAQIEQIQTHVFTGLEDNWWPSIVGGTGHTNNSQVAKSNDAIFEEFISNYDNLDSDTNVFIQWSHAERNAVRLSKNLSEGDYCRFLEYEKNQLTNGSHTDPKYNDEDVFNVYNRHLNKTMGYMKSVQEMCALKNINYGCWTADNMSNFKDASTLHPIIRRTYDSIDSRLVFNWAESLETYNTNFAPFIVHWATRSFPICFGLAFGSEVDEDQKHLTVTGHEILGNQLAKWWDNRDLDLEYNLTTVSLEQAEVFKDLISWANIYQPLFKDAPHKHWVEADIMMYLKTMAKRSADFIYES